MFMNIIYFGLRYQATLLKLALSKFLRDLEIKGVGMEAHGIAALVPSPRLPCFQAPFFRAFLLSSKTYVLMEPIKKSPAEERFFLSPLISFFTSSAN